MFLRRMPWFAHSKPHVSEIEKKYKINFKNQHTLKKILLITVFYNNLLLVQSSTLNCIHHMASE